MKTLNSLAWWWLWHCWCIWSWRNRSAMAVFLQRVLGTLTTAHFGCLPHLTHLIQLNSSSRDGKTWIGCDRWGRHPKCAVMWGPQNRFEKHCCYDADMVAPVDYCRRSTETCCCHTCHVRHSADAHIVIHELYEYDCMNTQLYFLILKLLTCLVKMVINGHEVYLGRPPWHSGPLWRGLR